MSLINKMLQDLDARGSQSGAAMAGEVRPVMVAERRLPVTQIALAATLLVISLGAVGYYWLKAGSLGPAALVVAGPAAPATALPKSTFVVAQQRPDVPAPATAIDAVTPPPPVKAAPVGRDPLAPAATAMKPPPAPAAAVALAATPAAIPAAIPAAPRRQAPVVRVVESDRLREALVAAPRVASATAQVTGGRDMNSTQRAESLYRQSLAALDEGRVSAATDGMEQALKLNARHDAARQSLVSLLIEAGRKDEAMQQLEQGLAADPSQAQMAMLLARMQIERGMSGVATLQRTLPAAQNNGEYRAFLGGALQREQRHREAAEQYLAALRSSPEQGVWLMGLAISLQADKREAEALAAFQRAKTSGMLTPALMTFVQGRISQLQGQ